jgi:hypothetical protein
MAEEEANFISLISQAAQNLFEEYLQPWYSIGLQRRDAG